MKTKLLAIATIGLSYLAYYLYQKNKASKMDVASLKESERHHLTNVFSKAKKAAIDS